ncbi:MAG: hypothetical protein H6R10_2883 [Rhodocyclaceae bacterium]|nr:hypothetical protein [Rhodocyclaceae bacterium]
MSDGTSYRLPRALIAALVLALAGAGPGLADDRHDHDRARQALEAGEILPLQTILERVERSYPGQAMEVELERRGGAGWFYEIKQLCSDGRLRKIVVDARSGEVLAVRGRGGRHGGGR